MGVGNKGGPSGDHLQAAMTVLAAGAVSPQPIANCGGGAPQPDAKPGSASSMPRSANGTSWGLPVLRLTLPHRLS